MEERNTYYNMGVPRVNTDNSKTAYEYDKSHRLVTIRRFKSDGTLDRKKSFDYDLYGNIQGDGWTFYTYKYDKHTNWVEKTTITPNGFSSGNPTNVTTRIIEYYITGEIELFAAIEQNNISEVKQLLNTTKSLTQAWDASVGFGFTPLHSAARSNRYDICALLIASGAEINAVSGGQTGDTPLHEALRKGNNACAELLIRKGASLSISAYDGNNPLLLAAVHGNRQVISLMIEKGVQINEKTEKGITPLYKAAESGNREAVETLLSKGADVNVKTNKGMTPLDVAIGQNHTEVATLLREAGGK